ncbi:5-methylcytosine rRNA methyltransferase NSUN4 isoform X1 [Synchiropus splendidus]|uniref:5-methylcytosine rRNA methyltransferase NSUN4 isoform X1 n=1 Tax=Synchiropus splendidus TaxID=270530 RepID=UPI00237EE8AF|nr:5-methylcytosine rRNA methyltransferase NSUN4 isoform X1 [Synchiropus splendidus]
MVLLLDSRLLLNKIRDIRCFTPRRNRVKVKWAASRPKYPPTTVALQHCDVNYGSQLGDMWPSIRVALLSERKYGALINNFSHDDSLLESLKEQGCVDFFCDTESVAQSGAEEASGAEFQGSLRPSYVDQSVNETPSALSPKIQCLVFPRGDISRFKPAKPDMFGLLGYYLMDAASVLPCLALDVQEGHSVLDLCAAPGGKTLALMQTQSVRFLCVNDSSVSRTTRLRGVLNSYIPKQYLTDENLRITSFDGTKWGEIESNTFDRVLVDVPCTTDRHSLMEEDNNIFSKMRTGERRRLPALQLELLLAGIQAACPGGEIVYSTCTLSNTQNVSVVEQAIHSARENCGIKVELCQRLPHFSRLSPRPISLSAWKFTKIKHLNGEPRLARPEGAVDEIKLGIWYVGHHWKDGGEAGEEDAGEPGPVGQQERVCAGCARAADRSGQFLEISLLLLQKWRRCLSGAVPGVPAHLWDPSLLC